MTRTARVTVEHSTTEWTDKAGNRWELTAHWSIPTAPGGRATMIGLDVRSFRTTREVSEPTGIVVPRHRTLNDELTELTQHVLRAIPIAQIRETTRVALAEMSAARSTPAGARRAGYSGDATARVVAKRYAEKAESLTTKGTPRKRAPAAPTELLQQVARYYLDAAADGRTKKLAKAVEQRLRSESPDIYLGSPERAGNRVRQWIARAREAGLIPPVREGK